MALVNQAKREINAKIVFFGPGAAGKATSLKHVHSKLKPEYRGPMKVMNVQNGRMLFFDFTPPGDGNVDGYRVRFHLYTVSGSDVDPASWKMVLKGVDGVVFVGDSARARLSENRGSMENLQSYLNGYGQNLATIPTVLQYNKSDLPDALPLADIERSLNPSRLPGFRTSSQTGDGVLQALMALVKTVLSGLRARGAEGIASADGLQRMVETPAPQAAPIPAPQLQTEPEARPEPVAAAVPEPPPAPVAPPAPEPSPAAEEELSLELAGPPRSAGGDRISVPLTIRSGSQSKSVLLTLSLSVAEG